VKAGSNLKQQFTEGGFEITTKTVAENLAEADDYYIYARVSTKSKAQKEALERQVKTIKDWLKEQGIKKRPKVFKERASGTDRERKQLLAMFKDMGVSLKGEPKKPKNAVVIVRDIQRFARDGFHLGHFGTPLREASIPIIAIQENITTGTSDNPDPTSDMMNLIFTAIGSQEVLTRKKQAIAGAGQSKTWAGGYAFLFPFEPENPYRTIYKVMQQGWVDKGQKPDKEAGEFGITEAVRRVGNKSPSFLYKTKDRLRKILERSGEKGLKEWFDFVDKIRAMEREHGYGYKAGHLPKSTRTSARMEAVRKMSEGYIQEPYNTKRWGKKPTDEELQYWFDNFKEFETRSRRLG